MSHETHHHRIYFLTCEQYDALFRYADWACMRCGRADVRLQIDHDHAAGWEAVRGLVCAKCNTRVARAERGEKTMDVLSWRYIQEAWWLRARPGLRRWSAWGSVGQPEGRARVASARIPDIAAAAFRPASGFDLR